LDFFRRDFDVSADTFLIDPACNNPRAKHVYMKAGFEHVCDFLMEGECSGAGQMHHLLIKKFEPIISVISATLTDYPMIQNMARFYVYDLSKECGHISADWALPVDGLYESFDFKNYFEDPSRKAYLVKVYDEIAGFVLLWEASTHWNMGEFFIIAKFQGQGIGERVARHIWDQHPGIWEVSVIPENKKALSFWRKTIPHFQENTKIVDYDPDQPKRIIFTFDTKNKDAEKQVTIRPSKSDDISALVSLSHMKRLNYEKAHPQFWKYAGADAEISQTKWFEELLLRDDHIMLTAQNGSAIIGFIIGKMMSSPEVYNPGGLTLMIDDFCIAQEDLWGSVGKQLISEINLIAKTKGAVQTVIVTGNHDNPKRDFLKSMGLTIASQWYVGGII
jgi:predicted acetyltransferase